VEPIKNATSRLRAALGRFLELAGAVGQDRYTVIRIYPAGAQKAIEPPCRRTHLAEDIGANFGRIVLKAGTPGHHVDVPPCP